MSDGSGGDDVQSFVAGDEQQQEAEGPLQRRRVDAGLQEGS